MPTLVGEMTVTQRILSDEAYRNLTSQPGWQETLRERIERWPPAQRENLARTITAGIVDYWRTQGWTADYVEHLKRVLARAGAWDLDNDRVSISWLQEQMYRWMVENMTTEQMIRHSIGELERLIDFQLEQDKERGPDITP